MKTPAEPNDYLVAARETIATAAATFHRGDAPEDAARLRETAVAFARIAIAERLDGRSGGNG